MTKTIEDFTDALALRACDIIDRECAVEDGKDHHVALLLLAAGNVISSGLSDPRTHAATSVVLPRLCEKVSAEMLRRQNQRDPGMH